jgi:hypothetical protein
MIPLVGGFLLLGSANLTLSTEAITFSANMGRNFTLHGIVRWAGIYMDAETSCISILVMYLHWICMGHSVYIISPITRGGKIDSSYSTAALNS